MEIYQNIEEYNSEAFVGENWQNYPQVDEKLDLLAQFDETIEVDICISGRPFVIKTATYTQNKGGYLFGIFDRNSDGNLIPVARAHFKTLKNNVVDQTPHALCDSNLKIILTSSPYDAKRLHDFLKLENINVKFGGGPAFAVDKSYEGVGIGNTLFAIAVDTMRRIGWHEINIKLDQTLRFDKISYINILSETGSILQDIKGSSMYTRGMLMTTQQSLFDDIKYQERHRTDYPIATNISLYQMNIIVAALRYGSKNEE